MSTGITVDCDLRTHLLQADAGVLVAVLAQLTGDAGVVDRFAGRISHVPDPPEQLGVADDDTMAELADAIVVAMSGPRPADIDPELFERVAPVALGGPVGDEYFRVVVGAGRFQPTQPVLPRTSKLPPDFRVAIIGAGMAGMTAALACADAGIDYEIYDRNDGWVAPGTPPSILAWTPRRRTTRCLAISTATGRATRWATSTSATLESIAGGEWAAGSSDSRRRSLRCAGTMERAQWEIRATGPDGDSINQANVVVPAVGYLNRPRWSDLEGQESFGGISIHSALWDRELDLTGKRVAIIGGGLHRGPDRGRHGRPGGAPHGVPAPAAGSRRAGG